MSSVVLITISKESVGTWIGHWWNCANKKRTLEEFISFVEIRRAREDRGSNWHGDSELSWEDKIIRRTADLWVSNVTVVTNVNVDKKPSKA